VLKNKSFLWSLKEFLQLGLGGYRFLLLQVCQSSQVGQIMQELKTIWQSNSTEANDEDDEPWAHGCKIIKLCSVDELCKYAQDKHMHRITYRMTNMQHLFKSSILKFSNKKRKS